MTQFRQALLDELQSRVTEPAPVPRRTAWVSRPRLAFGGVAVVAAVAATAVAVQGAGSPAYAVTTDRDGTVSVTVNRVEDPAEVNGSSGPPPTAWW